MSTTTRSPLARSGRTVTDYLNRLPAGMHSVTMGSKASALGQVRFGIITGDEGAVTVTILDENETDPLKGETLGRFDSGYCGRDGNRANRAAAARAMVAHYYESTFSLPAGSLN